MLITLRKKSAPKVPWDAGREMSFSWRTGRGLQGGGGIGSRTQSTFRVEHVKIGVKKNPDHGNSVYRGTGNKPKSVVGPPF